MRAVNLALLAGNWSEPEELILLNIPSPSDITARQIGVARIVGESELPTQDASNGDEMPMLDEDFVTFRVMLELSWQPPLSSRKRQVITELEITRYTIVVGADEIEEPFGEIPMESSQQDAVVS